MGLAANMILSDAHCYNDRIAASMDIVKTTNQVMLVAILGVHQIESC